METMIYEIFWALIVCCVLLAIGVLVKEKEKLPQKINKKSIQEQKYDLAIAYMESEVSTFTIRDVTKELIIKISNEARIRNYTVIVSSGHKFLGFGIIVPTDDLIITK